MMSACRLSAAAVLSVGLGTLSCGGGEDSAPTEPTASSDCGDVDGNGGDTGNVPAVLGSWNVSFGEEQYSAIECSYEGLTQEDLEFMDGAMTIDGRVPDRLYAEFSLDGNRYFGLQSETGGIVFSGQKDYRGYTLHISFGGLVYESPLVDNRAEIRGYGYIGVDGDGDNAIDCFLQGTFRATRSGS